MLTHGPTLHITVAAQHEAGSWLQGSLTRDLPLPGLGSVRSFSGRRQDTEIFFSYTDFTTPGANYRCPSPCLHASCTAAIACLQNPGPQDPFWRIQNLGWLLAHTPARYTPAGQHGSCCCET